MAYKTQQEWNGTSPEDNSEWANKSKRKLFIVHYLGDGSTETSELSRLRSAQNYHRNNLGYSDIAYNDAVGQSGTVYEGRGIDALGGHTKGHPHDYAIVALLYDDEEPSEAMKAAILDRYAQVNAHEGKTLKLTHHRGVLGKSYTSCPGPHLEAWIDAGAPLTTTTTDPIIGDVSRGALLPAP